ncbi:MAG TPA: hypothetical protein PLK08_09930, partial [Phycisphaerae bacterium]|nr:hypothetical protein [Phycisphaerae bacterium]
MSIFTSNQLRAVSRRIIVVEPIPKTLAACNRLFCSLAASEKRQNILKYVAIFLPCQPAKLLDFGDAH